MTKTDHTSPAGELLDYCATCFRELGCDRLATVTRPHLLHRRGPGKGITGYYQCKSGHEWRCWWAAGWLDAETA